MRNIPSMLLKDEAATETAGSALAGRAKGPLIIFLHGDLGAGKTTWVRGFLRGLGYNALVKSPTYTLVESYSLAPIAVHHFDWYRIDSAKELEMIGIWDYVKEGAHCLIEWPQKGEALSITPDLELWCEYHPEGRTLRYQAHSAAAQAMFED